MTTICKNDWASECFQGEVVVPWAKKAERLTAALEGMITIMMHNDPQTNGFILTEPVSFQTSNCFINSSWLHQSFH